MSYRFGWLLLCLTLCTTGCRQQTAVASNPDPRVDGDRIAFAANAPQLASLAVEAVGVELVE